jgi:hypothetical protein
MCALSLLIFVGAFVLLRILPRKIRNTAWRSTIITFIGWCVAISSLVACLVQGVYAINLGMDLLEPSYQTYTGAFEWNAAKGKSAMDSAFLIDEAIAVSEFGDAYSLTDGRYTGKVVYARHSKVIVQIETKLQS